MPKAEVTLTHKTGPVVVTISAATPEVAAYMANRLKQVFSGKPGKDALKDSLSDIMGMFK